ncbi:fructose-specific phosphocarrier protein HPr /PTS systemfructose-specific IIA component [Vibrio maritimus]|uniref:Fructose-specific phosphocarrier protein HPr /PTS systemfructose-specific IIA component n=1 Tax=Vibrio maritimus TaxID=990268 RepID=A0A090T094_9VIBR|nr:fructose-specific phosphocarrier protein HPr /PTS systemfructose-specific IIA component [Vibrio maritimus]
MLQLDTNTITLNQSSDNKLNAIKAIAADLTSKGLVQDGYVDGMLNREGQNSTFLGNGIASHTAQLIPVIWLSKPALPFITSLTA